MLAPVPSGGLLLELDGNVVLEETVADRPTAILDGMIFAIFGLQDYCFACPDEEGPAETLAALYASLERLLPRYDLGYWSRADLYSAEPPMPASAFYHGLHVAQLQVLAELTGRPVYRSFEVRWRQAAASPLNRGRAFLNKLAFKFFHY